MIRLSASGLTIKALVCETPSTRAVKSVQFCSSCRTQNALKRSNGGGIQFATGRAARGLLNAAGRYCRGAWVAFEMVEGTNFELDFIEHTHLIPLMQHQ